MRSWPSTAGSTRRSRTTGEPANPEDRVRAQSSRRRVNPPADLVDVFVWHDGIDNEAWERDNAATGFGRLFGDTHFAPLADAVREYRERIEGDETTALYSPPGAAIQTWRPTWFPAFCQGWDTYAVDCDPDSGDRGRVRRPRLGAAGRGLPGSAVPGAGAPGRVGHPSLQSRRLFVDS